MTDQINNTDKLKLPKFRAALAKIKDRGSVVVVGGETITTSRGHYVAENRLFTPEEVKAIQEGTYDTQ